jgi:hypothetical protein
LLAPLWIVVALQQQRAQQEQRAEEEDKTPYSEDDLMQDWEFKIVRCQRPSFARRDFLTRFLAEEAVAGWQLVELFDGQRIRLKRPTSRRSADAGLPDGYGPYRLVVTDPVAQARAVRVRFWVFCGLCAIPAALGGYLYTATAYRQAGVIVATIGVALMLLFGVLAWRSPADPKAG